MTGADVEAGLRDILRRELVRTEAARHRGAKVLAEKPEHWPGRDDLARKIAELDEVIGKLRAKLGRCALN